MPTCVERQRGWRALAAVLPDDFDTVRAIESQVHAKALDKSQYHDSLRRVCEHLRLNPTLGVQACVLTDEQVAEGTVVQEIETQRLKRVHLFKQMLQEKFEALNDREFTAIVKCRRCGNADVTFDEKQTRSADEAATIFCHCGRCGLRWVIR